jgi:hypothetical protein
VSDLSDIRDALIALPPDVSSSMAEPPEPRDIYSPPDHQSALDPGRALIVGARGMGKSFWAGAYTSQAARSNLSKLYPRLGLHQIVVAQGFTGTEGADAPSRRVLAQLLLNGASADDIWRAVLLRATLRASGDAEIAANDWPEWIRIAQDALAVEARFDAASRRWLEYGQRLVVVFDALDRLGDDWPTIRALTLALLRTALDFRSYRGVKLKIFMRPDQFDDGYVFAFPDASKLRAEAVRLEWKPNDLYGLLFTYLSRNEISARAFSRLAAIVGLKLEYIDEIPTLPLSLRESGDLQEALFTRIAGQYMGSDHRRGKTYTWLTNHLMDAKSEVSPRSFLRSIREAARFRPAPTKTVIDPAGIRDGIKAASQVRFDQLLEDHPWARLALEPLADQQVPCEERDFVGKWRARKTVAAIESEGSKRVPVEFFDSNFKPEIGLLEAFIRLGVVERRDDGRINMPDVYRVAARLLRKGGVPVRRAR